MKILSFFLLMLWLSSGSFAQQISPQVLNCAGQTFSTSTAKLAYSIGEIAITKIGNSNNSITQGFFQPKIIATTVKEISSSYKFIAYPNPSNDLINISSDNYQEPISVKLIDAMGREVFSGKLTDNILSLQNYQNGIYQLLILSDKQQLLEHKTITKLN